MFPIENDSVSVAVASTYRRIQRGGEDLLIAPIGNGIIASDVTQSVKLPGFRYAGTTEKTCLTLPLACVTNRLQFFTKKLWTKTKNKATMSNHGGHL